MLQIFVAIRNFVNSAAGSTLGLERILAIPLKAKMVLQKAQVVHVATVGTALRLRFRVDLPVIKRLEKTVRKNIFLTKSDISAKNAKMSSVGQNATPLPAKTGAEKVKTYFSNFSRELISFLRKYFLQRFVLKYSQRPKLRLQPVIW